MRHEPDEGPIAESDPVQALRDTGERAGATEEQHRAKVRQLADRAQRAIDRAQAAR